MDRKDIKTSECREFPSPVKIFFSFLFFSEIPLTWDKFFHFLNRKKTMSNEDTLGESQMEEIAGKWLEFKVGDDGKWGIISFAEKPII